jgi:hypothetical protein
MAQIIEHLAAGRRGVVDRCAHEGGERNPRNGVVARDGDRTLEIEDRRVLAGELRAGARLILERQPEAGRESLAPARTRAAALLGPCTGQHFGVQFWRGDTDADGADAMASADRMEAH